MMPARSSGVYVGGIGVIVQPVITSQPRSRLPATNRLRMVYLASPSTGTNATRPSSRGSGITSCACPHQLT
jgi:hypothetical protein